MKTSIRQACTESLPEQTVLSVPSMPPGTEGWQEMVHIQGPWGNGYTNNHAFKVYILFYSTLNFGM